MQISELVKVEQQKRQLVRRRQKLIQAQLRKKQRDRINVDQSSLKKGFIEKTKIIQKKTFETVFEKARKIEVAIQDNVSANTFINENANLSKFIERTRKYIVFDQTPMKLGVAAISAYGISNHQKIINLILSFQKPIDCNPRPSQITIPYPQPCKKCIVILPSIKENDNQNIFNKVKGIDLQLLAMNDFTSRYRNNKKFAKDIQNRQIKCFVDFQLFKTKKIFTSLLAKGIVVFPIDRKKIPFRLKEQFDLFSDYISDLSSHFYYPLKSGQQQVIRVKLRPSLAELGENIRELIVQVTARLLQKSKSKLNKMLSAKIKTSSSIQMQVYKLQQ